MKTIVLSECEIEDIFAMCECTRRMREIAEKHINDDNINARHLSDLMHRFADKIDELDKQRCESIWKLEQEVDRLNDEIAHDDEILLRNESDGSIDLSFP